MVIGEPLFVRRGLSSYLDQELAALRNFVEKFLSSHPGETDTDKIVSSILEKAHVEPLAIDLGAVTKDVQPTKVRIRDYGQDIEIDGVRASRTYPFTGEPDLFYLQPNTWTSVIPYGIVSRNQLTIGIEGRNDPTSIKGHLDSQEELVLKYMNWQRANIEQHNLSLGPKVQALVSERLKHLDEVARLKDLI